MPTFNYVAYDQRGEEEKGDIEAEDEMRAREVLRSRDLLVTHIGAGRHREPLAKRSFSLRKPRVKGADVAWMARQLATAQSSGLPVFRAISMIARQKEGTPIGAVLDDIHAEMANGRQMSRAFGDHEEELGTLTVAMIAAGESAGTLDDSLDRLAEITESRLRLRSKIRSALAYPVVVLALTVVLFLGMLIFVAPTFASLYADLGGTLPLPTRIVMAGSNLLTGRWYLFLLLGGGVYYGIRRIRRNPQSTAKFEGLAARAPLVGGLVTKTTIVRFTSTLASTLQAGVPLLEALEVSSRVSGSARLSAAVVRVREDVRDGRSLHLALANHSIMPEMLVRLVEVGEDTGRLPELLDRYSRTGSQEIETAVDGLTSLIEPLLIALLGILIGGMLIALYLPMIQVINLI